MESKIAITNSRDANRVPSKFEFMTAAHVRIIKPVSEPNFSLNFISLSLG